MRGRVARTIILGTIAAVLGIAWLAREFDIDSQLLLEYATGSVIFVAACIGIAGLAAFLIRLIRRR